VVIVEASIGLGSLGAQRFGSDSPWKRLRALISLEHRELATLIVYAVVLGGLSLAVPVAAQVLVNTIAFGSLLQPLVALVGLLLGVLVFSGLVQVVQWYAVEVLQRRIFVRVAEDFARRLTSARYEAHDETDVQELSNRFFEVVGLQKAASRLLLDGLGLALQTLVGLLLLAFYHPVLLAFDVALIIALGIVIALGWGAVPTAMEESRAKYRVAAWLQGVAGNPALFKRESAARLAALRTDALTREYLRTRRRHYARVLRQLIGGVGVQVVAMVTLLGLGGWLVIRGELTLGQLVAAELVVGLIGVGFAKIGKHLEAGYDLLASLDKIGRVIDLPCDETTVEAPGSEPFQLRVSNVWAREGVGGPINVTIDAGDRLLVDGPPGTGKSSFLEVLAGLRQPAHGNVGGQASRSLRARAVLVRPDDFVPGTVLDNLRVARPEIGDDDAWALLRQVRLAPTVAELADGLDTPLLARGTPLSSVALARLNVARAIAADPQMMVIDGALDRIAESGDLATIEEVLGPRAPWAAVVVSGHSAVRERCAHILDTAPVKEVA
jgi:ABC-type bacteriocin/lantibiotic exporter with double-glycine peptidase domain